LTESAPIIAVNRNEAFKDEAAGLPLPSVEVKIAEDGEILARGPNIMKGYYNNPEATRAAITADGWLHTGDEASIDDRGLVRITGRIKDLIIRGGENISPKEIEDCLREHPAVADAYVYGLPDEFFGEIVAAAVRVKAEDGRAALGEPPCADDLIRWCTDRLARFKVPKHVRFVTAFPMTASGKVQKFKLREEHLG